MSTNIPFSVSNQALLVSQNLLVNKGVQQPDKQAQSVDDKKHNNKPVTLDVELLKRGDKVAQQQADDLFAQANSYAEVSPKVKQSLQAYHAIEISSKREAISSIMGIDLYA